MGCTAAEVISVANEGKSIKIVILKSYVSGVKFKLKSYVKGVRFKLKSYVSGVRFKLKFYVSDVRFNDLIKT
jgi:hypothetical protein